MTKGCKETHLHFGQFVGLLQPLALALRVFEQQLLDLAFGLLPAMLRVSLPLHQRLHLNGELVPLRLQSLLGLLHGHFVLQGRGGIDGFSSHNNKCALW